VSGADTRTEADPAGEDDRGRDDAGREDDSPGFDLQARIFAALGSFLSLVSIGYGFLTYEWAGTVMLALTGGLLFTVGGYVGWKKPAAGASVTEHQGVHGTEPWFPAASIWPFAVGLALVLAGNGLLLGTWLLLPSAVFLAFALGGFVLQSRRRT